MKVFLSYSMLDREAAEKLRASLAGYDIDVADPWEELAVGDVILERLQDEIRSADAVIVLVSRNSEKSSYVSTETSLALFARDQGRVVAVIPVLVDRDSPLPVSLRHVRAVDMSEERKWEAGISEIVRALRMSERRPVRPDTDAQLRRMGEIRDALDAERADYATYSSRRAEEYAAIVSALTAVSALVVGVFTWYLSARFSISGAAAHLPSYITYAVGILGPLAMFIVGYGVGRRRKRDNRRGEL